MLVLLNRELIIKVLNYLLQILKLCLLLFHQCMHGWGIVFDISLLSLALHLILSWFYYYSI